MEDNRVYTLVVTDEESRMSGIIRMHDLLQANVI